jgi:hypothetical protein
MNKTQPVHEIRLGAVKVAIWENATRNGTLFNVTVQRLYRDDDQWKHSDSFGRDDLLLLAKLADQAHTWICGQAKDERQRSS